MSLLNLYDAFTSKLHQDWKQERILRQRIPLQECWRGCVGLALLLDRPDDTEYHGTYGLVRNSQLRWLILRDIPRGHFPGCDTLNKREVHLVNSTVAVLRHGMPVLDFRSEPRNAWDFRFMPFARFKRPGKSSPEDAVVTPGADTLDSSRFPHEFAVLNALSQKMTQFAFWAIDNSGQPYRPAWARRRPSGTSERFQPAWPQRWMPRAYLAFPLELADRLYWRATESQPQDTLFDCYNCRRTFLLHTLATSPLTDLEMLDNGNFLATCPDCRVRHRWYLEDARPCHYRRYFSQDFRLGFLRAIESGFVVRAIGPEIYRGRTSRGGNEESMSDGSAKLDLAAHNLISQIDGKQRTVFLPAGARITVRCDEKLEAGQIWAEVLNRAPSGWYRLDQYERWKRLAEVCGGGHWVGFMQQLWFRHRMIRLTCAPDQIMLPADLAAPAVHDLPPSDLWWEMSGAMPFYDWETQSAAMPPIAQSKWSALRFSLPGEVELIGDIVDPRFSAKAHIARPTACIVASTRRHPVSETTAMDDASSAMTETESPQHAHSNRANASCVV